MKQQKLTGYMPNYPRKAVKGMALAAAALVALGTGAGCRARTVQTDGAAPTQESTPGVWETARPEDLELEGAIAIDDTETPKPEPPMTTGLPLLPEETPEPEDVRTGGIAMPEETPEPDEPMLGGVPMPEPTPEPEEIVLMGDVAIFDEP